MTSSSMILTIIPPFPALPAEGREKESPNSESYCGLVPHG